MSLLCSPALSHNRKKSGEGGKTQCRQGGVKGDIGAVSGAGGAGGECPDLKAALGLTVGVDEGDGMLACGKGAEIGMVSE